MDREKALLIQAGLIDDGENNATRRGTPQSLKKKQDEEQAVHRAEAEEAVMVKTEYLRVEGERIRVEMEAKEDERIRLQCTVEFRKRATDSQREGTREETRDEQQIEVDEVQEEGIIQD